MINELLAKAGRKQSQSYGLQNFNLLTNRQPALGQSYEEFTDYIYRLILKSAPGVSEWS